MRSVSWLPSLLHVPGMILCRGIKSNFSHEGNICENKMLQALRTSDSWARQGPWPCLTWPIRCWKCSIFANLKIFTEQCRCLPFLETSENNTQLAFSLKSVGISFQQKNCKQPKHITEGKWINKLWPVHTLDYYREENRTNDWYTQQYDWTSHGKPKTTVQTVWSHLYEVQEQPKLTSVIVGLLLVEGVSFGDDGKFPTLDLMMIITWGYM